ncbi:MAG: MFS transporter, partial [Pigmentiphaga sp.]
PSHLIAETSAGSAIWISLVNIVAPVGFAMAVATTGRYDFAFISSGVCSLLVLVFLPRDRR